MGFGAKEDGYAAALGEARRPQEELMRVAVNPDRDWTQAGEKAFESHCHWADAVGTRRPATQDRRLVAGQQWHIPLNRSIEPLVQCEERRAGRQEDRVE